MRRTFAALFVLALSGHPGAQAPKDPAPHTLKEFQTAVQKVLDETGVPGAGIALVRQSGMEWAGGVGLADRDRKTPVTADTHFRAGSISKTFIAMALVQLAEDGDLDLDAPVAEIAPQVDIENPWDSTDPVRVIHLLQHTAGFDDMHFNETYNLADPPDLPLEEVLRINPGSRKVRWRPGTRMSYANPDYGVAAFVLEQATGRKFEDVIQEKIFDPIGMATSSFVLTRADEKILAKGYAARGGPPVPYAQIYLRPAGNLHTSAAELGQFVHLLLNWGETPEQLVVDPEYLSNMEHPRTTLAADAGLRNGYGSAIYASMKEPFPLLGHNGGIDGFSSTYAYSPARDVGFVVLLNATYSNEAMDRISSLAIRYLKADVDPPEKPTAVVPVATLRRYEGYYQDASPRLQAMAFVQWLLTGRTVAVDGNALSVTPVFGQRTRLVPASDTLFRAESDVDATQVFTLDETGTMVLTGTGYAERVPRWRVEIVRWPVLISYFFLMTPVLVALIWLAHARRAWPMGFWWLKVSLLLCAMAVLAPVLGIAQVSSTELGLLNPWTFAMFVGPVTLPVASILSIAFTVDAIRKGAGRWLRTYAVMISIAALTLSAYLLAWGIVGFKPWSF